MTVMTREAKIEGAAGPILGIAGTSSVRTPCGARRAENVRPGDLIVTRDHGLQPVRMVWARRVTANDIAADPSLAPVRMKPRAIGPMMPQRDLLVAGNHKILVPGYRLADVPDTECRLISARALAEASDEVFFDRAVSDVTFYNITFDTHQVFCVNGLPVESYLPSAATLAELDEAGLNDLSDILTGQEGEAVYPPSTYAVQDTANCPPELV
ncbi:Hint domain-containing protein [Ovoidimarina sediminis]|uniref:Hint domain-containing protein n=1 Tax=Ovoidimarina sediminis TaxID=3079856 RepID=UPI00290F7388|nr:Hint domain-containing protein [Rhodophyticola sp. MJ-SS7]MDU8943303.1 Hint domain-containing protein [Rhodophyticola sp. MJ-SS7]